MGHHLHDPGIVGNHKSVKAPSVSQDILHEPFVGSGWNALHFVEGHHHAAGSCIHSCLVRFEILVEHTLTAHVDGVVVPSGLRSPVQGKMLDTGHHLPGLRQL